MAYNPVTTTLTEIPVALNMQQVTTPSTLPVAGYDLLYFKSDDNLYRLTSSGLEIQISGAEANLTLSNLASPTSINQSLLFASDNVFNIGASAASRPANVYVAHSLHINGNDPSAALEASSSTQGFLMPRMTTAQMNAIASPAPGLMIFNTDILEAETYYNVQAFGQDALGDVKFTAVQGGYGGNSITVEYIDNGNGGQAIPSVFVTGMNIIVYVDGTLHDSTTTVQDVINAINTTSGADTLIVASLIQNPSSIVTNSGPTTLMGGFGWGTSGDRLFVPYVGALFNIDLNNRNVANIANLTVNANSIVGGTLNVTGLATLSGGLNLTGSLNVTGVSTLTGNLLFNADNTYNIGALGANRPAHIYASALVDSAGTINLSAASGANLTWSTDGAGSIGISGNPGSHRPYLIYAMPNPNSGPANVGNIGWDDLNYINYNVNHNISFANNGSIYLVIAPESIQPQANMYWNNAGYHIGLASNNGTVGSPNSIHVSQYLAIGETNGSSVTTHPDALQIFGNTNANIIWAIDGGGNIGASGANRPNNAYLAGLLNVAGSATIVGIVDITNATASTSISTGALVVSGGVGIAGALFGTTASLSTSLTMTAAASTANPSIYVDSNTGIGLRSAGILGLFAGNVLQGLIAATSTTFGNLSTDSFLLKGTSLTLNISNSAAASNVISQNQTDGNVIYSGGNNGTNGGNMVVYGSTHATKANYIEFRNGATVEGSWDTVKWNFGTVNINSGTINTSNVIASGFLEVQGSTTSYIVAKSGVNKFYIKGQASDSTGLAFYQDNVLDISYIDGAPSDGSLVLRTNGINAISISNSQVINIPTLTASEIVVTDASKNLVSSAVSSSSLGYLLNAEALQSFVLADNQSSAATIESWVAASFSSFRVDYSINRNGNFEFGSLVFGTDGTNTDLSQQEALIGISGITFSTTISGANILLRYTSTSTGHAGTMKYTVRKWLA